MSFWQRRKDDDEEDQAQMSEVLVPFRMFVNYISKTEGRGE